MKKVVTIIVAVVFVLSMAQMATAGDRSLKEDAKSAAKYTGGVVTGSVNTVGEAAYGTTETAVSPIKAFWRNLIGKGKPQEIVTDPVNTGGKTVYDATVNTGKTVTGEKR